MKYQPTRQPKPQRVRIRELCEHGATVLTTLACSGAQVLVCIRCGLADYEWKKEV